MNLRNLLPAFMILVFAVPVMALDTMVPSLPYRPPAQDKVLATFMQASLTNKNLTAAQRSAVLKEITAAEKSGDKDQAITQSLIANYPELGKALAQLADEKLDVAIPAFKKMAQSKDAYLAAHAEYYLARAYFMEEKYEDAIPLLAKLAGKEKGHMTMHAGEALFYQGICHNNLVDRADAMQCLFTFIEQNHNASERLLIGARHMLDELALLEDGSLFGDFTAVMYPLTSRLRA